MNFLRNFAVDLKWGDVVKRKGFGQYDELGKTNINN